jgi:hypothetical protein
MHAHGSISPNRSTGQLPASCAWDGGERQNGGERARQSDVDGTTCHSVSETGEPTVAHDGFFGAGSGGITLRSRKSRTKNTQLRDREGTSNNCTAISEGFGKA